MSIQEHTIQTSVLGKFLVRLPAHFGPAPLLAGFHGYGQTAEDEFKLLCAIPGSEQWLCCSIEALHSIYTQQGNSGASWMTSRDRDQRIEENVRYVDAVIVRLKGLYSLNNSICFHGFSQGTGMACRAALLGRHAAGSLMLLGGDIPPELSVSGIKCSVHLARGTRDHIYSLERYEQDAARLLEGAVPFVKCSFAGVHGVNDAYFSAAGDFLDTFCSRKAI